MQPLTVKLEQHTPVLHFQQNPAAPIRATEVKPKLDKFIIANYDGDIPDEWFVNKDNKNALNYKVRISCESIIHKNNSVFPMYFGKRKTAFITGNNGLELTIFCLNKELRDHLDKKVDWTSFFLTNNFGTRQSKGYGSFFVEDNKTDFVNNKQTCGKIIKTDKDISYRVDSFFTVDAEKNDWSSVMTRINDVYKCLRGGINENGLYFKSLLFFYAENERLYWDKRIIKNKFYPDILKSHLESHKDDDLIKAGSNNSNVNDQTPYMFRDYLGLSTNENWKIPYEKIIQKKNSKIARFKSPILFKPIYLKSKWYVFLLHREIPLEFKSAKFKVYDNDKVIKMKPYPNFFMSDYMNFVWTIEDYNKYFTIDKSDVAEERKGRIKNDLACLRGNYVKIDN